jgi:hypothetical protein
MILSDVLLMLMMRGKAEQCAHVSYIYHFVDSLFGDFELQKAPKRRINVESFLPFLLSSCIRMRPLRLQGLVFRDCRIAIMRQ